MITAIVLTKNEELHIERCLKNLEKINAEVKIVDSFSVDNTISICKKFANVEIYQNPWINYATQFNWAINNCRVRTSWVMRIDADEYLDENLIEYLKFNIDKLEEDITGIFVRRLNYFMGKPVKYGDGDVKHLKIWRNGLAYCENKWMDEHMLTISGESVVANGILIDSNLNGITNFISKHISYATREAIDFYEKYGAKTILNKEQGGGEAPTYGVKSIYYKFPLFLRPFIYYLFSMIVRGGIFSGMHGVIYHTVQKLGYRFLIDLKIYEAKRQFEVNNISPIDYLKKNI